MSKISRLEQAYKDLQMRELPDLWDRIEDGLETGKVMEAVDISESAPLPEKRNRVRYGMGLAAMACCAVIVIGASALLPRRQTDPAAETTAGTMAVTEAAGGVMEATEAAETTAAAMDGAENDAGKMDIPDRNQQADSEGNYAKGPKETAAFAENTVWYGDLELSGKEVPLPSQNVAFAPEDSYYFTEEILMNADLLCQITVNRVSYGEDPDGIVRNVNYDLMIDKVLYSEDYAAGNQKLKATAPLVGSQSEARPLYVLKEGGHYVLPLKSGEGVYELVFPYAPQIEVTEDARYVFHTGWQSLMDSQTESVNKAQDASGDFYFDRMVIRSDNTFLSNLAALTEAMKNRRK